MEGTGHCINILGLWDCAADPEEDGAPVQSPGPDPTDDKMLMVVEKKALVNVLNY
jgi:hypothetical protein